MPTRSRSTPVSPTHSASPWARVGAALPPEGREPSVRLWHIARKVDGGANLKSGWKRLLFVARSLKTHPASTTWYRWLASPGMERLAELHPSLYKKITRPYLTPGLTNGQKVRLLRDNYSFLLARLGADNLRRALGTRGISLVQAAPGGQQRYEIRLHADPRFNKEGELTLQLAAVPQDQEICSLTFVIERLRTGGHRLIIGCIQGAIEGTDRGWVKSSAKSFHGVRPKSLVLFVAQEIATAWGLAGIAGICNATHVSRHSDYRFNRTRRPDLGYDEFWVESGGQPGADGFHVLPLRHQPRPMEAIKPNKRSQYRQRYVLLDALRLEIGAALAALRPFAG